MPGSPPISTIEPGTMPPPSTRSNSPMPEDTRCSSEPSIASQGLGEEGGSGSVCASGRPLPGGGASSWRSSTKLFHSPQSGQRPSHFELPKPQAWQTKTVRILVMARLLAAPPLEVLEARELIDEGEPARAGRAVALLADDDLRDAPVLLAGLVLLLAVDEHHHVRVLLEGSRFSQVRQLRTPVGAGLRRARELGQRD